MPKKAGIVFVTLGAVLVLSALLLFVRNEHEARKAGQEAELLLGGLQSAMEEKAAVERPVAEEEIPAPEAVFVDGYECIGYLSIPALALELPILSDWDYARLKVAPGRHFGSAASDDLVIAGHNYETHFGALSTLEYGDEICLTEVDGTENRYTLSSLETLAANAVDAVQNSGHDLVLYTCTVGGAKRVAAFCDRVEETAGK